MRRICRQLLLVGPASLDRTRTVEVLQDRGYRVKVASSWLGALLRGALHARSLDLMVVDRPPPGLSGFELARVLRVLVPGLPVVLTRLTGRAEILDEVDALLVPVPTAEPRIASFG